MNTTLTLNHLAQRLAAMTGASPDEARDFAVELFRMLQSALAAGESVRIKGLGTFSLDADPRHPVTFQPERGFAEELNTPFAMFEPVTLPAGLELPDDLIQESILAAQAMESVECIPEPEEPTPPPFDGVLPPTEPLAAEPAPVEEHEPEPVEEPEPVIEEEPASDGGVIEETTEIEEPYATEHPQEPELIEKTEETEEVAEPEETEEVAEPEETEEVEGMEQYQETYRRNRRPTWCVAILFLLLGLICGFVLGWFAATKGWISFCTGQCNTPATEVVAETESEDSIVAEEPEAEATAEVEAEEPQPVQEIYDTVTRNCFLTTMARKHYDCMEFWVFIYKANPGLGNPNRIAPGTTVRIPSEQEFILAGESREEAIERARNLALQIYDEN